MKINFSRHARNRMEQRGIDEDIVAMAIEHGRETQHSLATCKKYECNDIVVIMKGTAVKTVWKKW